MPAPPRDDPTRRLILWVLLYLLNLPVSFQYGLAVSTGPPHVMGMIFGCVTSLAWTVWIVIRSRSFAQYLIAGAIPVGLSQFYPILHFYSGWLAMIGWEFMTGGRGAGPPMFTFTTGFMLTIMTGQLLLLVALVTGRIVVGIGLAIRRSNA